MGLRFGRYETIREIASGGMATVHLARVTGEGGFQRLAAIKVMHPHLVKDAEFVAMFLDEARLAARIRHPNVVATLDVQKAPEGTFLVMDYVEGASLYDIRRFTRTRGETLPLGIALRVMLDVLTGLHAAHELTDDEGQLLNLVHRDVSPQNVLIGKDGVARLTDFGVARAEARLSSTRGGQLKGKVAYMPPEQILGEAMDRRSDVYAAGVVLWETLVGHRLFRAANDGALVHTIVQGAERSPAQENEHVPGPISKACMRALSVNPASRHPTAAAFADELEDAARLAGVPVASSRTVSTFMGQVLPEIEQLRPAEPGMTPASGGEAASAEAPSAAGSGPSAPSPGLDAHSGPAARLRSPVASGPTPLDAVVPQAATSRGGPRMLLLLAAGALVVGGLGVALWLGLSGPKVDPAATLGSSSSAPTEGSARGSPGATEPGAANASSRVEASASVGTSPSGPTPSGEPSAAESVLPMPSATVVSGGHPRSPGGRPGSTAKPGATSYDPDKL
jgi:eukaryotic-like serine/threonine-protein kinase